MARNKPQYAHRRKRTPRGSCHRGRDRRALNQTFRIETAESMPALRLVINVPNPIPVPRGALVSNPQAAEFPYLASHWKKETRLLSSVTAKVLNKHYQRIIAMGRSVLPMIFRDLADNGGYWYWALECITGDDPAIDAADISEAKKAWLDYAIERGYLDADERRN